MRRTLLWFAVAMAINFASPLIQWWMDRDANRNALLERSTVPMRPPLPLGGQGRKAA